MSKDTVSEALSGILRKGDTLDAHDKRLRMRSQMGKAGLCGAIPGAVHGLSSWTSFTAVEGLVTPALLAGVLGAGVSYSGHRVTKRRIKHAETLQQAIRNEIDETVDVFRVFRHQSGKRFSQDHELVLRWYGLDHMGKQALSSDMAERMRHVADFADKHEIPCIQVDAKLFPDEESEEGGALTEYTLIEDEYAPDATVDVSPDTLRELAAELVSDQQSFLADAIIKQLQDPLLDKLFAQYKATKHPELRSKVLAHVRAAIERDGDTIEMQTEMVGMDRFSNRAIVRHQLNGGTVQAFSESRHPMTGLNGVRYTGERSLASFAGFGSREEMVAMLKTTDIATISDKQLLRAALYDLLYNAADTADIAALSHNTSDVAPDETASLFMRLADRDKSVDTITRGKLVRAFAGIAIIGGSFVAGHLAGYGVYEHQAANRKAEEEACKEYAGTHYDFFEDGGSVVSCEIDEDVLRRYREIYPASRFQLGAESLVSGVHEADMTVSSQLATFLINGIGVENLTKLFPIYDGDVSQEWIEEVGKKLHGFVPEVYASSSSEKFIGDVSNTSNKVLFTVTSLSADVSTKGYWQNSMNVALNASRTLQDRGHIRFSGVPIGGESELPLNLASQQTDIEQLNPEYMVETPYLGFDEFGTQDVDLPVIMGGTIVGARYVDKANPSEYIPADISRIGSQYFTNTEQNIVDHVKNMEQPVLQYWVKSDGDQIHAQPLRVYDDNQEGLSKSDQREIASQVRQELGLASDASDEEVYKVIKSKLYAYEPFKYAGVDQYVSLAPKAKGKDIIEEVGAVIAHLEALNCNVAAASFLTATLDSSENYNLMTGYRDNGDGKLVQQEAHAWVVDGDGSIVDPTPSTFAPGVEPREKIDEALPESSSKSGDFPFGLSAGVLLGAACMAVGWKRRQDLQRMSDSARTKLTLAYSGVHEAHEAIQFARYARPGTTSLSADSQRRYTVDELLREPPVLKTERPASRFSGRALLKVNRKAMARHRATQMGEKAQ
ncbi:MAG TPA: hypothetical protein VGE34_00810 [Candidatus Saccharimonadales bacterium]